MQFLLQELASGYALYEQTASEEIGQALEDIQKAILDFPRFSKSIALKSFIPFKSAAHALENINDVSEGVLSFDHPYIHPIHSMERKKIQSLIHRINRHHESPSQVFP